MCIRDRTVIVEVHTEEEAKKSESNKLILLYFLAVYITTVLLLTSLIASLYNKIRYGSSRQTI